MDCNSLERPKKDLSEIQQVEIKSFFLFLE